MSTTRFTPPSPSHRVLQTYVDTWYQYYSCEEAESISEYWENVLLRTQSSEQYNDYVYHYPWPCTWVSTEKHRNAKVEDFLYHFAQRFPRFAGHVHLFHHLSEENIQTKEEPLHTFLGSIRSLETFFF